jgi:uncharacterized membrane protein
VAGGCAELGYYKVAVSASPNNPLKLPFFIVCAAIGVLVAVIGLLYAAWWLAAGGLILLAASVWLARIVKAGRTPRWLRSPLDGRWPRQPE